MPRTKLIGWSAFAVCLLGYGAFAAALLTYKLGHIELREALIYGGPAAVAGEIGLWVAATTLYQFFVLGVPEAEVMSAIGMLALAANLASVWLLAAYKDGDANVRSVWLCSRNDAIGNVAVVIAAGLVFFLQSGIPDLVVAGVMSALFLSSASQILVQSTREWQHARAHRDHH